MQEIRLAYPASFKRDTAGRIVVRFPDLPEALTDGATEEEALDEAVDCLSEALMSRIADGEVVPTPRRAVGRGYRLIAPDPTVALKAALYAVAKARKVSAAQLARRLRIDPKEARRLLDPRHPSKAPRLFEALHALGCNAAVTLFDRSPNQRILSVPGAVKPHRTDLKTCFKNKVA
jgi:antitoxin HicB